MQELNVMAQHQLVFDTMRLLNTPSVEVSFSGSGDSGQIDSVDPTFPGSIGGPEWSRHLNHFDNYMLDLAGEPTKLPKLIHDLSQELLQADDIPDWYNGDGGNGTIKWIAGTLRLATATGVSREREGEIDHIEMTVNQAVVSYDTSEFSYDCYGRRNTGEDE